MSEKIKTLEEAISLVQDGDIIWINSFSAVASPVELNKALTERFRKTGHPTHLEVYSPFSFSDWDENSDVEGYICEGAVDRVVIGFFGSLRRTSRAIMNNEIEGYNLPGGVMSHMIRAAARTPASSARCRSTGTETPMATTPRASCPASAGLPISPRLRRRWSCA